MRIILIFLQPKKIAINLNLIIKMSPLIFYMFLLIQKKIEKAYKLKYNLIRDNQIILLMIKNGENWHYLAVKSLSR